MAENVFATQNFLTMSRSKMTRRVPFKTSMPFGKLVPLGGTPLDVLPGSTVKLDLANITRMLTPVAPIMDDISMDVYSFFVPWRLVFNKTKQFFGENDEVAWTLVRSEELPHIVFDFTHFDGVFTDDPDVFSSRDYLYLVQNDGDGNPVRLLDSIFKGSLFDYFGLPFVYPSIDQIESMANAFTGGTLDISFQAMPFRAMQLIYNEFFRNENITDPILDLLYDGQDLSIDLTAIRYMYLNKSSVGNFSYNFWFLPSVARWKDLFTSLLPAPQRGPAVALPLGDSAPVKTSSSNILNDNIIPLKIDTNVMTGLSPRSSLLGVYVSDSPGSGAVKNGIQAVEGYAASSSANTDKLGGPVNLYADLSNVTMATVNQIRYAFATQRYYEKLARGGARYHEYLKVMFGVRPADAVLQRPQFLGGHHERINVQQVLQTSETSSTPLGSTGAYSVTGFKSHTFTNSFNEFGLIMNFGCIRKQHTYCQGMDKYWTKRDVFDIYNPTFAHIGEVPVAKNEVYWQPGNTDVLGYNEAWYEYRFESAKCAGLLNPLAPENLSVFVLTDVYKEAPTLSDKFIFEDPNGLDRVLVGSATYTDQFICDFLFDYTISAVMPVHSTPGLIDHY